MNRSFFITRFALHALCVAAGFTAWLVAANYSVGRAAGSDRAFLLWSGWIALLLFVIVGAYSFRKFIHRMGISPEFKLRVMPQDIERAESRINEVRREIEEQALTTVSEVASRAKDILESTGVHKVLRAEVSEGPDGLAVDLLPTEPLGRVSKWMHAHIFLGLAGAVLVFLHGGGNIASPFGLVLNGLSLLVIVSGIYGIIVWSIGPGWMTRAEHDLSVEEAFILEQSLGRKVEAALAQEFFSGPLTTLENPPWESEYVQAARAGGPFAPRVLEDLVTIKLRAREMQKEAKEAKEKAEEKAAKNVIEACSELVDFMTLAGQRERITRESARLMRVKSLINSWRTLHVPASVLLLGLLAYHVLSVWYY